MRVVLHLVTLFSVFVFFSCNQEGVSEQPKGENPPKTEHPNSYRIAEILISNSPFSSDKKIVFSYEQNQLIKIEEFEKGEAEIWSQEIKTDIVYEQESTIAISSHWKHDQWNPFCKEVFIIENEKIQSSICSDIVGDALKNSKKTSYDYVGNLIDLKCEEIIFSENISSDYYSDYELKNEKIQTMAYSTMRENKMLELLGKDEYTYAADDLTRISTFSNTSNGVLNNDQVDFVYTNGTLSTSKHYRVNKESETLEMEEQRTFTYNNYGCLETMRSSSGEIRTYINEANKTGNAHLFYYTPEECQKNEAYFCLSR